MTTPQTPLTDRLREWIDELVRVGAASECGVHETPQLYCAFCTYVRLREVLDTLKAQEREIAAYGIPFGRMDGESAEAHAASIETIIRDLEKRAELAEATLVTRTQERDKAQQHLSRITQALALHEPSGYLMPSSLSPVEQVAALKGRLAALTADLAQAREELARYEAEYAPAGCEDPDERQHRTEPCPKCGEPECHHGSFGFRDHAYVSPSKEPR